MLSSHGVGYETYMRDHDVRMNVEMKREKEYKKSQDLVQELEGKVINHL
ncbi:hypothetical protein [Jeotgalibacillus haloalkalitolerans]|nr:hypothetical protein [Jeotgalibacillus sp. HH7-29]